MQVFQFVYFFLPVKPLSLFRDSELLSWLAWTWWSRTTRTRSAKPCAVNRVDEVGQPLLSLNSRNRIHSAKSSHVVFLPSHSCAFDGRGTTFVGLRSGLLRWNNLKLSEFWFFFPPNINIVNSEVLLFSAGWSKNIKKKKYWQHKTQRLKTFNHDKTPIWIVNIKLVPFVNEEIDKIQITERLCQVGR